MRKIFLFALLVLAINAIGQDSTDIPIRKKFGLGCFPLDSKASLNFAFGNKGQFIVQNNFELDFYTDETKLFYAWKSCGHKKLYSGAGVMYQRSTNFPDKNDAFYGIVTPIGFEWHPIKRLRKLGIIIEGNIVFPADKVVMDARYGLSYYF